MTVDSIPGTGGGYPFSRKGAIWGPGICYDNKSVCTWNSPKCGTLSSEEVEGPSAFPNALCSEVVVTNENGKRERERIGEFRIAENEER